MPEAQATARTEEQSTAIAAPEVVQTAHDRFGDPKNFINRELSWLEFNRRVLEEAQDQRQPLIERVKFLTIVSSNLDEFFEIRVAGIKQQIESETSDVGPDGLSPSEVFNRIQKTVRELVAAQYALWKSELLPELAKNGIYVREIAELPAKRAAWAHRYFLQEVFPMLTPLAVDFSASVEPQSQSAGTGKDTPSQRTPARDRAGAAGGSAIDPDAAGERRGRTVGVHLSRLSH